jgi:c-di-GMP-binding flagellar brake protein YcgR
MTVGRAVWAGEYSVATADAVGQLPAAGRSPTMPPFKFARGHGVSLKSLLKRWLPGADSTGAERSDRFQVLEQLQRRHSFIEVKFPRIERAFQSMILELRPESGVLVIDELYPPEGREKLLEGDIAEISGRDRGLIVNFFSRLLLREAVDGAPMYHMELPEDVGASYRRHAFRVYVENEPELEIDLRDAEGNPLDARIVNLSADGIKISLHGDRVKALEHQPEFEDCVIRLPDAADIECQLKLSNVYLMRSPTLHTLAGASMKIGSAPQRTRLDQYLAAVQRRQRRRETRTG